MSQKYEKLKTLLQELFQLDQPDLDFGLYRVMHAKSAEVSQFLDKDLLPQVRVAFGQYKTAEGKDRVFILAAGDSGRDFIAEEDGEQGKELVIRFEYRPATLTDWPNDARDGKSKPPAQKDLIALAAKCVLAAADASLAAWIEELGKLHIMAGGEKADYTRLEAHLKRYTARNTFDYFIHKDLGGFLRRELDFYIKNEVMHLDDVETRGSQSLLNVQSFTDPTAYKLKVKRPGSDESREVNVDLLETFNWLIGLTVRHIAAPQTFSAAFERDSEKRLRLKGRLKLVDPHPDPLPEGEGERKWWFRTVTGTTPDGRKTLIIWRKYPGSAGVPPATESDRDGRAPSVEQDNLVLDEWFTRQGYSARDSEFDLIYVNGGNNLENLKAPDDTWKVRRIEEDFHRLMFEMEGA